MTVSIGLNLIELNGATWLVFFQFLVRAGMN